MEKFHFICGLIAGFLSALSYIPYIISIIRGKTKPARASWIIWSLLSFVILASYKSLGASTTLFVVYAYAVGTFITMLLSLKYGVGGWTRFDKICLLTSALSLVVWWLTNSAFLALLMNILIDVIGTLPTIKKVYHQPDSEDRTAWSLFFLGSFFNLLAINQLSLEIALYPSLLFLAITTIFYLMFIRQRKTA